MRPAAASSMATAFAAEPTSRAWICGDSRSDIDARRKPDVLSRRIRTTSNVPSPTSRRREPAWTSNRAVPITASPSSKTSGFSFRHMGRPRLPRASNGRLSCREPSGAFAASAGGGIRQDRVGSSAKSHLVIHRIVPGNVAAMEQPIPGSPSLCGADRIGGGIPRDGSRICRRLRYNADFPHLRGNGKTDWS